MTRQEAIKLLTPFRNSMVDQYGCPISDVVFALDVAIEALEKEPNEDCISRAEVLDIYSDLYWIDERLLNFKDELDKVYEKLRNAQSVVPKEGIEE